MNELLLGLNFVKEHELHPKEVEIVLLLIEKPDSFRGIGDRLNKNLATVSSCMMKLRHKKVISLKKREECASTYEVCV